MEILGLIFDETNEMYNIKNSKNTPDVEVNYLSLKEFHLQDRLIKILDRLELGN